MLALKKGKNMGRVLDISGIPGMSVRPTVYREDDLSDVPHYHETTYMTYVLEGGVTERRKHFETECVPGTLTFFHAGEEHECVNEAKRTRSINFELVDHFFEKNNISESQIFDAVNNDFATKFSMLRIYSELFFKDEFSEDTIEMEFLSVLQNSRLLKSKKPAWAERVRNFINDCWNDEIKLDDLARVAGVHRVTVSKGFRKYFGCSFGEYRRRVRIEKSFELINRGNNLTDVALDCGFFDQSHFTRTFKNLTGFSPKKYSSL